MATKLSYLVLCGDWEAPRAWGHFANLESAQDFAEDNGGGLVMKMPIQVIPGKRLLISTLPEMVEGHKNELVIRADTD